MDKLAVPHKTEAGRERLAGPRQALPAALRMLLITVDGRKTVAQLLEVARSLGLSAEAFAELQAQGLIRLGAAGAASAEAATAPPAAPPAAAAAGAAEAARLVRAKFFAMDLAARMLAGRDAALRERARDACTPSSFAQWLDDCASEIGRVADDERATLFRERVAAVG
ncbi:MAG: hypothetical protein ABW005_08950 [Burkholderiaceae bacterium]